MSLQVLLPHDGSAPSDAALAFVAERFPDAEVTLLRVLDPTVAAYDAPLDAPLPGFWQDWYEEAIEEASAALDRAADRLAESAGVRTRVEIGKPAAVILSAVESGGHDHVVMGSHGRDGVSRLLLGSVAETVVRRSPVPVTVVR